MKLPEFNLFFVKSARIFLIFPKHLPEFPWFSKIGGGAVAPPPPCLVRLWLIQNFNPLIVERS